MGIATKISGLRQLLPFDNRAELVVRRLLFPGSPLVEYRYKGRRIFIDHSAGDECGIRPCLVGGMYRPFLARLDLPGNPVVLDIGANAGGFSLMLALDGLMPSHLVAVEMNPLTCARLQLNLYQNLSPLPRVLNAALTGEPRTIRVPVSAAGTGQSIYESTTHHDVAEVQGITLDEIIERNFGNSEIDICKIDIEGAEYEVFGGAAWERLRQSRNLLIEIHSREGKSVDTVKAAICGQGFELLRLDSAAVPDVYCFKRI